MDGIHRTVYARKCIVVVLPLVKAAHVVGCNLTHFEQVDILLHRGTATAFVGIVAAHVENPVGCRSGECLVVAVEVCLESCVCRSHESFHRLVVELLLGKLSLGNSVEHI